MADRTENQSRIRFRFENDTLVEESPLQKDPLGLTMNRSGFSEYLKDFSTYLCRLRNGCISEKTPCPFCDFDINIGECLYEANEHEECFVSTEQRHKQLWDDELILTFNPSGWHLINELIIPRDHINMLDFLTDCADKIVSVSHSRWERHSVAIERKFTDKPIDYYHATVLNLGSGQSVSHGHAHCYTSTFNKVEYRDARVLIKEIDTKIGHIEISIVPFDHPRLVMTMDTKSSNSAQLAQLSQELVKLGTNVMRGLFDTLPPMSIGWFCPQGLDRAEIVFHPMQRRGTIQVFQDPLLHKFGISTIREEVRKVLNHQLEAMNPNENIFHEPN